MPRLTRQARLFAWILVIAAAALSCTLAYAGIATRGVAAAGALAALSAMLWLLATTPGDAIRLPKPLSEITVLAGMVVLTWLATGHPGFTPLAAAMMVVVGHARPGPGRQAPRWRWEWGLGNPWRLAPALWHPALWLTALHPWQSALVWAGLGLCAAAAIGVLLATTAGFWTRGIGLGIWVVVGAAALRMLW